MKSQVEQVAQQIYSHAESVILFCGYQMHGAKRRPMADLVVRLDTDCLVKTAPELKDVYDRGIPIRVVNVAIAVQYLKNEMTKQRKRHGRRRS
jgi:CO dehydrogenase/acetyl-CoA synthase epsilon subunit